MTTTATSVNVIGTKSDIRKINVTAVTAAAWLKSNKRNRPISETVVQRYRADIVAGRWVYTADPIRFSDEGKLLDGQHRLTALSTVPGAVLPMLVITGLPDDTQLFMDQGRKRTAGGQLALLGVLNSNNVAAASKLYLIWHRGLMFKDNKVAQLITAPQIQEWVAANDDLVRIGNENHKQIISNDGPPSVALTAFYKFTEIDPDDAAMFFRALATGIGLAEGSPILALDRRLRRLRRDGLKMSTRDHLALFIQAWNAFRTGKRMTKFQRPVGGLWNEENYPVAK